MSSPRSLRSASFWKINSRPASVIGRWILVRISRYAIHASIGINSERLPPWTSAASEIGIAELDSEDGAGVSLFPDGSMMVLNDSCEPRSQLRTLSFALPANPVRSNAPCGSHSLPLVLRTPFAPLLRTWFALPLSLPDEFSPLKFSAF